MIISYKTNNLIDLVIGFPKGKYSDTYFSSLKIMLLIAKESFVAITMNKSN